MKRPLIVRFKGKAGVAHRMQWGLKPNCILDVIQADRIENILFYQVWTPNHKQLWLQNDEVEKVNFHQLSTKEQKEWNKRQTQRLLSLPKPEQQKAMDLFFNIINRKD